MDLSAVAGSPAFIALQTLASSGPGASATPTASARAGDASASTPSPTAAIGAGAGVYAASQGVGQALSAADAAASAGQSVLGLLTQMRQVAAQAGGTDLATAARQALDQAFQAGAAAISPTLQSAAVGGVNLVDGSSPPLKVTLGDGAQTALPTLDLRSDGPTLALGGATLATAADAATAQGQVETAIQGASGALAGLQARAGALATHAALVQSAGQTAVAPSADAGDDGARLLALQVSQQLSAQTNAIANATPQQILALFRS